MQSKEKTIKQFKKHLHEAKSGLGKQFENTRNCQAFYAGDFMSYNDSVQFRTTEGSKRAIVQFNQVKPYVNAVKGFMAQNRRNAQYIARVDGSLLQKQYSTYANALKDYLRENCHADHIETIQDADMLINGYGVVETALSYGEGYASVDVNGEVVMGRIDPLSVWWDRNARQPNLIDARYCGYERIYHIEEAVDLFANSEESDFESASIDLNDEGYSYLPNGGRYDRYKDSVDWADKESQMVRVHFYKWYEVVKFYRAKNPVLALQNPAAKDAAMMQLEMIAADSEKSNLFEFNPNDEILSFDASIKAKLEEAFGEFIEVFDMPRKVFYEAVCSGDTVFTQYESISQQGFSLQFKTGDYDEKNKIWVGMVNSMMQPALYYNKALTELMFVIAANSKGGVLVERGAVEDIREFEDKYARTDSVCEVNEGALSGGKIQPKKSPFSPTGYEEIISITSSAMADVTGIDKSFLGSSENKLETGVLQRSRIRQVVSSLACYFDSITLFQKLNARLFLELMRVYAENNAGNMFRIVGEEGADEFVKISQDKLMAEFDVKINDAPQTADQKQEFAQSIVAVADKLLAVGDVHTGKTLYSVALNYMPIDEKDIERLRSVLVPQQGEVDPSYVQQLEQQLQALQSDAANVQIQSALSNIAYNNAKVEKTIAEIETQRADTAKTFEDAKQRALENDIVRSGGVSNATVSI